MGRLTSLAPVLLLLSLHQGSECVDAERTAVDCHGDPLPPGALARLGTVRLRVGGHQGLAFTPDGTTLASAAQDGTLRLWDMATGRELKRFGAAGMWLTSVALSPDGKTLAAGGGDHLIRLWDVSTGKELRVFKGHEGIVSSVAFSPDGTALASGSAMMSSGDSTLRVWEVHTGKQHYRRKHAVRSVAFFPDGKTVASGGEDGTVRLWEAASGEELRQLKLQRYGMVSRIAVSPDGKIIAAGQDRNSIILLWEAATGKELKKLAGPRSATFSLAFSLDGKTLTAGGWGNYPGDRPVFRWNVATGEELPILVDERDAVSAIALSPDGKLMALGRAAAIEIRDAETGKDVQPFPAHRGGVYVVAFSPDGQSVVTGSFDRSVRLWDAATGKHRRQLPGVKNYLRLVAFPDEKTVTALEGPSARIHFWNAETGEPLPPFTKHPGAVSGSEVSPDGKTLVTVGTDSVVRIWDRATEKQLAELGKEYGRCFAFSQDSRLLAFATNTNLGPYTIHVHELPSGKELRRLGPLAARETRGIEVQSMTFAPDGKTLAIRSRNFIVLLDATTGKEIRRLAQRTGEWFCLAFAPDGKKIAAGGSPGRWLDYAVYLYDVETGRELGSYAGHQDHVSGLAFRPDGKALASASGDGTALVWDLTKPPPVPPGKEERPDDWPPKPAPPPRDLLLRLQLGEFGKERLTRFALSRDGRLVASGGDAGTIHLWDLRTRKELWQGQGHAGWIPALAISNDGKRLASGGHDRAVVLWDVATGKELKRLIGHNDTVSALAFSPDGKVLASGSFDQTVALWDCEAGQELRRLKGHERHVLALAFSPDGALLASGGGQFDQADSGIRLWDGKTGKELRKLPGHRGGVFALAFSPDGERLASGSYHGPLLVWDAAAGKLWRRLEGHRGQVASLTFSLDGRVLASGASGPDDSKVRLWELSTGQTRREWYGHTTVRAIAFAPDGKTVISAGEPSSATVHTVLLPAAEGDSPVDAAEAKRLWGLLADRDADWAFEAMCKLLAAPNACLAVLREQVQPVTAQEMQQIDKLIEELDHKTFAVRETAVEELRKRADLAEGPVLRALAANPGPEARRRLERLAEELTGPARSPRQRQLTRAVELLESFGTPEAQVILRRLAGGASGAMLTEEADGALKRLTLAAPP